MSTLELVDPELRPLLARMPEPRLDAADLPGLRAAAAQRAGADPLPDRVERVQVESADGAVRALLVRPLEPASTGGALLWLNGGGYVLGDARQGLPFLIELADRAGVSVLSPDYRLAPEHPFPAALDDARAAPRWLVSSPTGSVGGPLVVGGESAGGALAAALAAAAREDGVSLAGQVLVYPMLDDRTTAEGDPNAFTGEFFLTREVNCFGWRALLGDAAGGSGVPPLAAAARLVDLSGLPPAFIAVGALDLFLDEDTA